MASIKSLPTSTSSANIILQLRRPARKQKVIRMFAFSSYVLEPVAVFLKEQKEREEEKDQEYQTRKKQIRRQESFFYCLMKSPSRSKIAIDARNIRIFGRKSYHNDYEGVETHVKLPFSCAAPNFRLCRHAKARYRLGADSFLVSADSWGTRGTGEPRPCVSACDEARLTAHSHRDI